MTMCKACLRDKRNNPSLATVGEYCDYHFETRTMTETTILEAAFLAGYSDMFDGYDPNEKPAIDIPSCSSVQEAYRAGRQAGIRDADQDQEEGEKSKTD